MANPIELVKAHPVIATSVVVVVVGVVFLFGGGGGSGAAAADTSYDASGDMAASAAMQQMQASFGLQQMQITAEKEVALNDNATKLTLAGLSKDVALDELSKGYNFKELELASNERSTTLISTLQAKLQTDQIAANAATTAAMFANIKAQTDSATALANINASTQVQLAQISAGAQAEANKPKGLFSFIFG